MAEVKHKATGIFVLFILDIILAVALIPILEITTGVGYADSTIGSFLIFMVILVLGAVAIGADKADKKYHVHERVYNRARKTVHRKKLGLWILIFFLYFTLHFILLHSLQCQLTTEMLTAILRHSLFSLGS